MGFEPNWCKSKFLSPISVINAVFSRKLKTIAGVKWPQKFDET